MNSKILLPLIFSILLLSTVSATMIVDGYFQNDIYQTQATITNGESITLHAIFSSTGSITSKGINLPSGLSSDAGTCTLSSSGHTYTCTYTITPSDAGIFDITVIGTDCTGSTDSAGLILTVNPTPTPINHAPVITSTPVTQVNEGTSYNYHATATDSDGDTLTYSLVSSPSWLSINSATGVISGVAPSVSADTPLTVTVKVIDEHGAINTQTYTLTVKNITSPVNHAPVITLLGSNPATVILGNTYTDAGATATDIEDGTLTSSIITSGTVNTNILGNYIITYSVTDSDSNTVTATRTVHVVSSGPTNHAPVITSSPVKSITEGNTYSYHVDATDSDGDDLTYSLTEAPGWLTINPNSGLISGVAPLVSSTTDYTVEIEVSDGNSGIDTQSYTLKVKNYIFGGSSGGSRVISDNDIYYQNKYFDQFNQDKVFSDTSTTQKTSGISISTVIYFILLGIIFLAIIIAFLLMFSQRKYQGKKSQFSEISY